VGDSLSIGMTPTLRRYGWGVYALKGIAIDAAREQLLPQALAASPDVLVAALGTNAGVSSSQAQAFLAAAAAVPRVVFVTIAIARSYRDPTNAVYRQLAAAYPDKVAVADFAGYAPRIASYFTADGIHLTGTGYQLMAQWLVATVNQAGGE
jgi:hypothetical protein